jgi:C-terminal processing protease CtpA/Prc
VQTNDNEEIVPNIEPTVQPSGSGSKIKNTRKVFVQRKEDVPLNNVVKALQQLSSIVKEENEFDVFGRSVASQLKKLLLQDALELQIQIQTMIEGLADPRGHYTNPSPTSWSTSTSSSYPNTPNPQQVFGHTEEAEQSQTVLDIDSWGELLK